MAGVAEAQRDRKECILSRASGRVAAKPVRQRKDPSGRVAVVRFVRNHAWTLAGLLAFLAVAVTFDPKLYINGDNVDYMNLARSVRQGHLWPSDKYPPLFPIMLAPVQILFGTALLPQKFLVTIFAGGATWLLAKIVRRRTDGASGPGLLFVAATLIPFVEFAHYTMSEIPFLFFLLAAVDVCDRLADRPNGKLVDRDLLWLALWIAVAFYIRTAGTALAGGVLVWMVLGRRFRQTLFLAGMLAIAAVPWLLHAASTKGGSPYLQQLVLNNPYYPELGTMAAPGWAQRLAENARTYFIGFVPVAVMPFQYVSSTSLPRALNLYYPIWVAVLLLVPFAVGLWRGFLHRRPGVAKRPMEERADSDPLTCIALTYLLLLCLWPQIWASSRFLMPIMPLLLLVWWRGWQSPEELGMRWHWGKVRAVILVLLFVLSVRNLAMYAQETRSYRPDWNNYFAALEWVRENTPKDAVLIGRKPGFAEFTAQRKALTFPREEDPSRMIEYFRSAGVTHVVAASLPYDDISRFLLPTILKRRSLFHMVYETPSPPSYVLEFHPEAEGAPARPDMR